MSLQTQMSKLEWGIIQEKVKERNLENQMDLLQLQKLRTNYEDLSLFQQYKTKREMETLKNKIQNYRQDMKFLSEKEIHAEISYVNDLATDVVNLTNERLRRI